jgi:hypothetical protein
MSGDSEHNVELARLADIAAEANLVEAVHALPGGSTFAAHIQRETAAYWATHDDDSGLTAWLQRRWPDAQRAWASDVAAVTGVKPERAPLDAGAILEAAEALRRSNERDERPEARHMALLTRAVVRRRGPFVALLEREMATCPPGVDPNEHMAPHREEMRRLFQVELKKIIAEARR